MSKQKKILIADDDASIRTVLTHALSNEGYDVASTDNGTTLFQWVCEGQGDIVITDVMMPGENGLDLIPKIRRRRPDMKVVVISAQNALTTAIAASERGAVEYLAKPFDVDVLLSTIKNALRSDATRKAQAPDTVQAGAKSFIVGQSAAMQEIYRVIARLRDSALTVLITGESGTGKEVIARMLHQYSRFSAAPFVAVNMAAIPRELIESALFGHEKGAFTGATQRASGYFEQAQGGTLFLDEIGDMPFEAQTRLLRVLQEGEFNPVGGRRTIKANVRVIAATNKNLIQQINAGTFREDLFFRINVVPIKAPPLRARIDDIIPLLQHFLEDSPKSFTPEAIRVLQNHKWPGNIREMENLVRRINALYPQDVIDADEVRTELKAVSPTQAYDGAQPLHTRIETRMKDIVYDFFDNLMMAGDRHEGMMYDSLTRMMEKLLIEKALYETNGNQIRAAEILGMNRNTLRTKMRTLKITLQRTV